MILHAQDDCRIPVSREAWRTVPGYEGRYSASTLGRIRNDHTGRILRALPHRDGYFKVNLGGRTRHIHTLIALTFLGPRPEGHFIDHISGDHANDMPSNLRYVSPHESSLNRKPRGESRQFTGTPHVYRHGAGGFFARVTLRDKSKRRLGRFRHRHEAAKAVREFLAARQSEAAA